MINLRISSFPKGKIPKKKIISLKKNSDLPLQFFVPCGRFAGIGTGIGFCSVGFVSIKICRVEVVGLNIGSVDGLLAAVGTGVAIGRCFEKSIGTAVGLTGPIRFGFEKGIETSREADIFFFGQSMSFS